MLLQDQLAMFNYILLTQTVEEQLKQKKHLCMYAYEIMFIMNRLLRLAI